MKYNVKLFLFISLDNQYNFIYYVMRNIQYTVYTKKYNMMMLQQHDNVV